MDKKSRTLLILIFVITFLSIGITFYKTVIEKDFEIVNTMPEQTNDE